MEAAIWGRIAERLLVVVLAGLFVTFGWSLFRIHAKSDHAASFERGAWKVQLRRVGPGVFFALFGAVVLVYTLTKPLDWSYRSSQEIPTPASTSLSSTGPAASDRPLKQESSITFRFMSDASTQLRRYVQALNTSLDAASTPTTSHTPAPIHDLIRARSTLEELRNQLVISQLGQDSLTRWTTNERQYRANPALLDKQTQDFMRQMEPWMSHTFARAP